MNDDQPIDIDQVGSDDSSMASGSSIGKKRAGAPAKYVWQFFKRYKDPLPLGFHQVCLGCQTCLKSCRLSQLRLYIDIDAAVAPIGNDEDAAEWIYNKCWHYSEHAETCLSPSKV